MSQVQLKNIKKSYGNYVALKNIDIDIGLGSFFTLLGPSGCGKTTLLRAIAGFHRQDSGEIYVGEKSIGQLPANKRNVGMVFQDYAVFPHLSVFDNVAFGLVQQKVPAAQVKERVAAILKTVHLAQHAERMPHQLSGGQQQRVGLARALVIRPKVLLMDEPLSNLDAKLRIDLRRDIRQLQQEFGITTVYVTHDQEEALAISDQVCVMYDGWAQQVGSPWAIYNQPANRFVATFVGSNNFMPVAVRSDGELELLGTRLPAPPAVREHASASCVGAVRPEKVRVNQALAGPGVQVRGVLRQSMFTGRELQLTVEVEGHGTLDALTAPDEAIVAIKPGHELQLGIQASDVLYFAEGETGKLLS
ncbi:ABC transporter ATP-binding protein [Polaromonas sp.]|uniref:ABC transporter ATP-binding protein n=1 Tax=Polaromonas sp. TaxID=1869339 RepID=UPI002FC6EC90